MSSQSFDLVVVSAFGRGNWLASEFASRGWRVSLLDCTSSLGTFDPRDVEGPFGLLEASDLHPSQRARLVDEGEFTPVAGGFTLWLSEGPLEFRSELTPFLLRAREIPSEVETYLRQPSFDSKEALGERRLLKRLQYSHAWLANFAHSLTAAAHSENYTALDAVGETHLFAPYGLRQLTPAGIARGFQNCQNVGVSVRTGVRLAEFSFDGKAAASFAYDDASGSRAVEHARSFVYCLSCEETRVLSDALMRTLFPEGGADAPWAWHRLTYSFSDAEFLKSLPLSFVAIDDVDLAWTRANMIVVRRRDGAGAGGEAAVLDAWVKVPVWMRRERAAYDQVQEEVRLTLERRLPGVRLEEVDQDLTPLLWPIFNADEFGEMKRRKAPRSSPNLFFDAPGVWDSLDWMGRFRHENGIVSRLEKLKTQWDAAARKAEAAAARRKNP